MPERLLLNLLMCGVLLCAFIVCVAAADDTPATTRPGCASS